MLLAADGQSLVQIGTFDSARLRIFSASEDFFFRFCAI